MLSGIKYFLRGCLVDVGLLVLYMFWINSMQLNECGRLFAFLRVEECTFGYFLSYGLHFGTLVLFGMWWLSFPLLAFAPLVGFAMDMKRMEARRDGLPVTRLNSDY